MPFNWNSKALIVDKSKVAANASLTDWWSDQDHMTSSVFFPSLNAAAKLVRVVSGLYGSRSFYLQVDSPTSNSFSLHDLN